MPQSVQATIHKNGLAGDCSRGGEEMSDFGALLNGGKPFQWRAALFGGECSIGIGAPCELSSDEPDDILATQLTQFQQTTQLSKALQRKGTWSWSL